MIKNIVYILCVCSSMSILAFPPELYAKLCILKKTYSSHIQDFDEEKVVWQDGSVMRLWDDNQNKSALEKLETPSFADQLLQDPYVPGQLMDSPQTDSGRIRYEPFFRTMYGNSSDAVRTNLVSVSWMPNTFGKDTYMLPVTTINDVHTKIKSISNELDGLVEQDKALIPFLKNPGGTFNWRAIANTNRLSAHSFGMTIDINVKQSQYWQWDLKDKGLGISESAELAYRNLIPWPIVLVFEKHGFIWGGKWRHYDTMHFEYRPELFQLENNK